VDGLKGLEQHLEKLVYFHGIAEAGSYTAAARKLGISQPALSRAVAALEGVLNVALFHRSRSGVKLTNAGGQLLDATTTALAALRSAQQTIKAADLGAQQGPIRLGTKEPFSIHIWPGYVAWARRQDNLALTRILDQTTLYIDKLNSRLWNDITNGKLDMALIAEPPAVANFASMLLFNSKMRLYQAGRAARRRFGGGASPKSEALICYSDAIIKQNLTLGQSLAQIKTSRPRLNVQSFDAAREMAVRGLGLSFLPHWIAAADLADERLEEVPLKRVDAALRFPASGIYFCAGATFSRSATYFTVARGLKEFCQMTLG